MQRRRKNKKWIWLAVERSSQKIRGFYVGSRETYATDARESYNLIDHKKHIVDKAHIYTVERTNRLLHHYLARFARKTYSVSKSLDMIFILFISFPFDIFCLYLFLRIRLFYLFVQGFYPIIYCRFVYLHYLSYCSSF